MKSAYEWLRSYTLTGLLPWVTEMYVCHRPPPPEPPPQGEDINYRKGQPRSKDGPLSFFMFSLRVEWPRATMGQTWASAFVMLGAGYTEFPKHGGQGLPVRPLQKRLRAP